MIILPQLPIRDDNLAHVTTAPLLCHAGLGAVGGMTLALGRLQSLTHKAWGQVGARVCNLLPLASS